MEIAFNPALPLDRCLRAAAAAVDGLGPGWDPQVRPADPRFGDYQANGILPRAKSLGRNPRELAVALLQRLGADGALDPALVETGIAGPGFINFRFTTAWQLAWLRRFRDEAGFRAGAGDRLRGRTVVVDYSSPNTAKEMHVAHIRSTVLGEAIARLLDFCGARVIRDNHIGDWGTQFGMLIHAIKRSGYDLDHPGANALAELEELYQAGHAAYREGGADAEAVRAELVKLQQGDPENTRIWERISEISRQAFAEIYAQLGIRFDHVLGESFYRARVDAICAELGELGIARTDAGALVVFHPEHPRFATQPLIIRKADGASNYATTDLATVRHRSDTWGADEMIYVVDSRQGDHFEQLFLTVAKWYTARAVAVPHLRHVAFGMILGGNGRPIKTKEGGTVKLKALLAEAVERAGAIVSAKNPQLPEAERQAIARVVGIGAVRYADLVQNRTSDYVFSWERMLALEGNTAPYLLYAVARIHSIFRRAGVAPGADEAAADAPATDAECALARKLTAFPAALEQTLADLRPHFLCAYLFELAGVFSTFYNADKVIVDDPAIRARRLLLCARTLRVLESGLHLLGLETLERM
jgi:arginyl-tRNA synthetase